MATLKRWNGTAWIPVSDVRKIEVEKIINQGTMDLKQPLNPYAGPERLVIPQVAQINVL